MKKKISVLIAISLCIVLAFVFFNKPDKTHYSPNIQQVNKIELEKGERYLILYHSEENRYYLGKVQYSGLDDKLYLLGDLPCNFKEYNDEIIICNEKEVIYPQTNNTNYPDEVFDIKELGLLRYSFDEDNYDMQILQRHQFVDCTLKPKYYKNYIPIDLIQC